MSTVFWHQFCMCVLQAIMSEMLFYSPSATSPATKLSMHPFATSVLFCIFSPSPNMTCYDINQLISFTEYFCNSIKKKRDHNNKKIGSQNHQPEAQFTAWMKPVLICNSIFAHHYSTN